MSRTHMSCDEYCNMPFNLNTCNSSHANIHAWELIYIILFNAIQPLACFNDCNSVRETGTGNTYSTCDSRSPTDCADTSQWRCHNCSCGTKDTHSCDTARELGLSQMRIPGVLLDDQLDTHRFETTVPAPSVCVTTRRTSLIIWHMYHSLVVCVSKTDILRHVLCNIFNLSFNNSSHYYKLVHKFLFTCINYTPVV